MAARDPTARFCDRVDDYRRGRPGYPPALLDHLERNCGLGPAAVVADVGAGTGILTELLLERGARVHAVEPNPEMARAAEARLGGRAGFVGVRGRAEDTGLPPASVDLVTMAQALHWFEPTAASSRASSGRRASRPQYGIRGAATARRSCAATRRCWSAGVCPAPTRRRRAIRAARPCWTTLTRSSPRTSKRAA